MVWAFILILNPLMTVSWLFHIYTLFIMKNQEILMEFLLFFYMEAQEGELNPFTANISIRKNTG